MPHRPITPGNGRFSGSFWIVISELCTYTRRLGACVSEVSVSGRLGVVPRCALYIFE